MKGSNAPKHEEPSLGASQGSMQGNGARSLNGLQPGKRWLNWLATMAWALPLSTVQFMGLPAVMIIPIIYTTTSDYDMGVATIHRTIHGL